jgi:2-C-methyl-D-erythritol 4-phosphate cytidylyltransferase
VKKYVIIVAGGSGQRMLSEIPKQFLCISGKPVLLFSIETFSEAIPGIEIILVLPETHIETWQKLIEDLNIRLKHTMVTGGETRAQSVRNGLLHITEPGLVAIHDGVRPLISTYFIKKLFAEAERFGNAIPVIPVTETVREIAGDSSLLLDRANLRLVQTPQVFDTEELRTAYANSGAQNFTDDAAVIEAAGYKPHLCDGDLYNLKLTHPIDMLLAETILRHRKSD